MPRGRPPLTPEERALRLVERREYHRLRMAAKRGSTNDKAGRPKKYATSEEAAAARKRQQLEWSARRPRKKKVEKIIPEM